VPIAAPKAAHGPVVQRSVLHKIVRGEVKYYSDLESGARNYDIREEAEARDNVLAAHAGTLASALTTSQHRARRVPTPFGHMDTRPGAKVRHQSQGPHSLSFISFEERLQNRLRKGQHAQLADQVLTPDEADAGMTKEYGTTSDTSERHKRYLLDYRSLYAEFNNRLLANDEDHGIGSAFHLVARKLLQLNPYTTYRGPESTSLGEDRHAVLGSRSIDTKAYAKYKDQAAYETYLQTRGDLYHSSDEEEEGRKPASGGTPYDFLSIKARDRKYARKKVEKKIEEVEKKEEATETEKRDISTREIDPNEEGSSKRLKKSTETIDIKG
jgi:hypothetical protein